MIRVHRHTHTMMPTYLLVLSLVATLMLPLFGGMPQQIQPPASPVAPALPVAEQLGRLPLAFEPAAPDSPALFQARALGGTLFFAPGEVLLARPDSAALRVRFLGADPAAAVEPSDPLPGRVSRFIGNDPALWQSDLPTMAALVYRQLYPGIDLRYDGASSRLKGTYLVAPGADPAPIRWRYDGATGVRLDTGGDLLITLAGGTPQTLAERAPVAWQDTASGRAPVGVAYDLAADGSVGFRLGQYDPALPLVIDPTLEFSSYFGGAVFDGIDDVAFDSAGNIYVLGTTHTGGFPVKNPLQPSYGGGTDSVLLKLSPSGTALLWSTYLGGSGDDGGARVLVDKDGIVAVGNTTSSDFPTTLPRLGNTGGHEIVVVRLDLSGTAMVWGRSLGGSRYDIAYDAALDAQGQVTLFGHTQSADFAPGQGPVYQETLPSENSAVVARLSADGTTLSFRSFLAGKLGALGKALVIAPDGGLVVGGMTAGEFPLKNPLPGQEQHKKGDNGFIAKLTPGATELVWSTYLGGNGNEWVNDLAVDSAGVVYATGTTDSGDFPRAGSSADPAGQDGFVSKISPDGQHLLFSAFQGASGKDQLARIALDPQGNIYLFGDTSSGGTQLVNPLLPVPSSEIGRNLLLIKLSNDGQTTQIRTLLGGSGEDPTNDGGALAVSPTGRVVLGASTASTDLPLRNPLQSRLAGDYDAVLMVIDTAPQLGLTGSSSPAVLPSCTADLCPAVSFTWTLTAPHRLEAALTVTLPPELDLVPGSVINATASGTTVRFSGTVLPSLPQKIVYQARARKALRPGSLLTTTASATTAGAPVVRRNLTVAQPDEPTGTLVMIYASGDNDLRDATLLLANKAERGAATAGVVGLLLLDGPGTDDAYLYRLQPPAPGEPDCFFRLRDPSCNKRYELGQTYWKWSDSLASADTLTDFVVAAQRAFPATRRVLSLVGHGGGWSPAVLAGQPSRHGGQLSGDLGGMLWDDHPGTALSTVTLARALNDSRLILGRRLDLLYLDACAMGQIEVAYELRDTADYLLASPNWKWAAFPYESHLADATAGDGRAIGEAWLANEEEVLADYPYTYTLLDLHKVEALRTSVNLLADALMTQSPEALKDAFGQTERYDDDQNGALDTNDSAVDLGSLLADLPAGLTTQGALPGSPQTISAAGQVRQALQSTVIKHSVRDGQPWLFPGKHWSWEGTAGLAIYLPLGDKDDWRRRYYHTLAFGAKSAWANMIDHARKNFRPPSDNPPCDQPCGLPPGQLPLSGQRPPVYEVQLPLVRR